MLITIYIIVATLNVLAKHHNYGINVKHDPDFDIRVRRDAREIGMKDRNENIFDYIFEYIDEGLAQESKTSKLIELIQKGIYSQNDFGSKYLDKKYETKKEQLKQNLDQIEEFDKDGDIRQRRHIPDGYNYGNNVQYNGYNNNINYNGLYSVYDYNSYRNSLYNPYNNSSYKNMYNENGYSLYSNYNQTHYMTNGYINAYVTPKSQSTYTGYGYTEAMPYKAFNANFSTTSLQPNNFYSQQELNSYTTAQTFYSGYNPQPTSFYTPQNPSYSQNGYFVSEKPTDLYSHNHTTQEHNGIDYTGYNNTTVDHNEIDYSNTINNDNITSTTPMVIVESCILCSFGIRRCPVDQRRVGLYCVPLQRRP